MLLLIIAIGCLLGLLVLFKIKTIKNRLMIVTSIVILLILLNLTNELISNIRSYMLFE